MTGQLFAPYGNAFTHSLEDIKIGRRGKVKMVPSQ